MRARVGILVLALAGCASHTGVIDVGQGRFMISKQAATGFSGLGTLKAEVIQEANEHCRHEGQRAAIGNVTESRPPYILGNYPRAEVEFRCVAP